MNINIYKENKGKEERKERKRKEENAQKKMEVGTETRR